MKGLPMKQQVLRGLRVATFTALAFSPSGQAIARDLHQLAADAHVAFLAPAFWSATAAGLAEMGARSIVPVQQPNAKASAKQGWPARALVFVAQKVAAALAPQTPAA